MAVSFDFSTWPRVVRCGEGRILEEVWWLHLQMPSPSLWLEVCFTHKIGYICTILTLTQAMLLIWIKETSTEMDFWASNASLTYNIFCKTSVLSVCLQMSARVQTSVCSYGQWLPCSWTDNRVDSGSSEFLSIDTFLSKETGKPREEKMQWIS